jgi:hypothetical protein
VHSNELTLQGRAAVHAAGPVLCVTHKIAQWDVLVLAANKHMATQYLRLCYCDRRLAC